MSILQEPQLTESQLQAKALVERQGGSFQWVNEDDKKALALDVDNKGRTFDFRVLKELPMLYAVRVFQGAITEGSIKDLGQVKNLHLLVILSDGLTDKGCVHIGRLGSIDKLDIKSIDLTEKGVRELVKLKNLRRLFLYNTRLKDKDTEPLGQMKWLQELVLPTTVTQEQTKRLARHIPTVDIRRM